MKSLRSFLITAGVLLGFSGLSFAQTTPASDTHHSECSEKMHLHMGQRHAQHLSALKSKLQLQSSQEQTWSTFEKAMQIPKEPMPHPDRAALEKMTTPERLDQMQAHKEKMDVRMRKNSDATKSFYATLTDLQKKVFDAETAHGMGGETHRHQR